MHIQGEYEFLKRSNKIKGIPKLINYYDSSSKKIVEPPCKGSLVGLVRGYIEGSELSEKLTKLQCQFLRTTVNALHRKGIARTDIQKRNIIINPKGKPFLIDLRGVLRKHSPKKFSEYKKRDYKKLDLLSEN